MRLITRSDFDGLVCASILGELGIVDEYLYTHPKELQDNKVKVTENDVLANVPYVNGCGLWFDHHSSENERLKLDGQFKGASENQPSAARVIYNYYNKDSKYAAQLGKFNDLLNAVDYSDSAQFTKEDILNPNGWVLLAFISDPRTNLGYHHKYKISNFDLMKTLPDLLRTKSVDEILVMPDFQDRIKTYNKENEQYIQFIKDNAQVKGKVILLDFREKTHFPSGNRFIEYTLFPDQNISVRLVDAKNNYVMISIGHSTINRSSKIDVGSLTLKYQGGGHLKVGTCQISKGECDKVLKEIIDHINDVG